MLRIFNIISYFFGLISSVNLPQFIRPFACKTYSNLTGAKIEEAELDLKEYKSVNDFFTRSLKEGLRPIKSEFCSPCDAELRANSVIEGLIQPQVKGKTYGLKELLDAEADMFDGGHIWNFYLSPKDYHHVHSPVTAELLSIKYIPGCLWPVNNFSFARVNNLFAVNERLVFNLSTAHGQLALVMVGACNVGKMSSQYLNFTTNQPFSTKFSVNSSGSLSGNLSGQSERLFKINKKIIAGERIGTFNLGSSVVLLAQKSVEEFYGFSSDLAGSIKLGESLLNGK